MSMWNSPWTRSPSIQIWTRQKNKTELNKTDIARNMTKLRGPQSTPFAISLKSTTLFRASCWREVDFLESHANVLVSFTQISQMERNRTLPSTHTKICHPTTCTVPFNCQSSCPSIICLPYNLKARQRASSWSFILLIHCKAHSTHWSTIFDVNMHGWNCQERLSWSRK